MDQLAVGSKAGAGNVMDHTTRSYRVLWSKIEARLDLHHMHWRERVKEFGQVRAVKERSQGKTWSDDEVFEAILLAVLSSNTVWSEIEGVRADLHSPFEDFSLKAYASHSETEIDSRFVSWFRDRDVNTRFLGRNLAYLIRAARKLLRYSKEYGAADGYFTSLARHCAHDPKEVALKLGSRGKYKLPSLGVRLAAEALKNLGFAVAHPNGHICRAMGSFGLVQFCGWNPATKPYGKPATTSAKKLREVMTVAEGIAEAGERPVVLVDNAIWMLCAKGEMRLTNSELAAIAR